MDEVRTDFLVAQPSFWSGLGRWLDIFGRSDSYNISPDTESADARALYSDWRTVGQELRRACQNFAKVTTERQGLLFDKSGWQSHSERNREGSAEARISGSIDR